MTNARFVAYVYRPKIALLVLLGIGFVVLGLWLCFFAQPSTLRAANPIVWIRLLGGSSIAFFGLVTYEWSRLFFLREPLMEIDEAGIIWRSWSAQIIPWHTIHAVKSGMIKGQPFISLKLGDDAPRSQRLSKRLIERLNRFLGFGDLSLTNQGSDKSFEEMRDAIQHHAPHLINA